MCVLQAVGFCVVYFLQKGEVDVSVGGQGGVLSSAPRAGVTK